MSLPSDKKKDVRILPVLIDYLRATLHYPKNFGIIILAMFGLQVAGLGMPLYLKHLIDLLADSSPSTQAISALLSIVAGYAAFGVLGWISRSIRTYATSRLEANVMTDLSNRAFSYLLGHEHEFFASNFVGALTRKVTRYSRSYEQILESVTQNFLPTIIFAAGAIYILSMRSYVLGLALFIWVVLFLGIQYFLMRWKYPLRTARVAEDSRMTGILSDVISNHSAVKLFAAEKTEQQFFGATVEAWRNATRRAWDADSLTRTVQQGLSTVIINSLFVGGVILWSKGVITVGDFVLIQVYVIGLMDQVWNLGEVLRRIYDAVADASEMLEILETPHGIADVKNATILSVRKGEIEFKNVSFHFSAERNVLDKYSLRIEGGEKIALVGPSGAGKSTVMKLLMRLHDPASGSITIAGQDLQTVTQDSLHKAVSFVPQEPVLFHRTLRENIAYGKPSATQEEIVGAAKQARCHDFISALPEGYDTYVGERGVKLSGGERQRVAIARAILKNAPILVLDEATSSLDSESEALIQEALTRLMEGKTVIAIAHRLSTIMKMDRIVVMEQGRAILSGSHEELLNQESNLYKKLWEIQAGGFIHE